MIRPLILVGICALPCSCFAEPPTGPEAGQTDTKLRGDWRYPVLTWETPVTHRGRNVRTVGDAKDPAAAAMIHQLRGIIVPKIEFHDTSISDAIDSLGQEVRRLDPEHRGCSIFLKLPTAKAADGSPAPEPKITLTATNLPWWEALRAVAAQAGMKVKIEPYAVAIVPISDQTDALVTATFAVAPGFFGIEGAEAPSSTAPEVAEPAKHFDAKTWLEAKGIVFPSGSSATYLSSSNKLVVRNTKENADLIEKLLPKKSGAGPEK